MLVEISNDVATLLTESLMIRKEQLDRLVAKEQENVVAYEESRVRAVMNRTRFQCELDDIDKVIESLKHMKESMG